MKKITKKKKKSKDGRPSIQAHHVVYEPEIITRIFRGEHQVITALNRSTKNVSLGIIHCLLDWIDKRFDITQDLDLEHPEEERQIFRHYFYGLLKEYKEKYMKLERITILDNWNNVYTGDVFFKIGYLDKQYVISFTLEVFNEEGTNLVNYFDKHFPLLDTRFKIEEINNISIDKKVEAN